MKVIILCGGMGTRLREETESKPKAMVDVGGKPMLLHIMKHFSNYGFNEFILALGYKSEYIKNYFINQTYLSYDFEINTKNGEVQTLNGDADSYKVTLVDTGLSTLTSGRILECKKYIPKNDEDFIVCYSDGVSDIDLKALCNCHKKNNKLATIVGSHPRSKYGKLHLGKNNIVTAIEEKPMMTDWTNAGFVVYKKEALKYFDKNEMDFDSLDKIAKDNQLCMYKHDGFWFAVDTYKELETLNSICKNKEEIWKTAK